MLSRTKLTLFSSLQTKKYRYKHRLFVVEGKKMIEEAIQSPWKIEAIIYREDWLGDIISNPQVSVFQATKVQFNRLSSQQHPEGILAILAFDQQTFQSVEVESTSIIGSGMLLCGIRDPGNLGTIIRSVDWFGLDQILLTEDCVDILNPKALRASMGSIFRIPVRYIHDPLTLILRERERFWVADMMGKSANTCQMKSSDIFVIGNESQGIPAEIRHHLDIRKISIPQKGGGESLNAAISASILAWQFSCNAS